MQLFMQLKITETVILSPFTQQNLLPQTAQTIRDQNIGLPHCFQHCSVPHEGRSHNHNKSSCKHGICCDSARCFSHTSLCKDMICLLNYFLNFLRCLGNLQHRTPDNIAVLGRITHMAHSRFH